MMHLPETQEVREISQRLKKKICCNIAKLVVSYIKPLNVWFYFPNFLKPHLSLLTKYTFL